MGKGRERHCDWWMCYRLGGDRGHIMKFVEREHRLDCDRVVKLGDGTEDVVGSASQEHMTKGALVS